MFDSMVCTVGANPLPVYLGIVQFTRRNPNAKIALVHSADTLPVAKRVARLLLAWKVAFVPLTDPYNPMKVQHVLNTVADDYPHAALNYTGGTKVMSACALLAWSMRNRIEDVFYVDEPRRCFWFYRKGSKMNVPLSIDDVIALHDAEKLRDSPQAAGWKLSDVKNMFEKRVIENSINYPKELINDKALGQLRWLRENLSTEWPRLLYQLAPAAYPDWITVICPKTRDKYCPISTSGGMPSPLRLQVEFITGIWFEEYVRIMLLSLERDGAFNWDKGPSYPLLSIKDVCSGTVFKINDTTFQSDIMLVKNHRLRYISVTTTSDQAIIKKKMFEAMIRSQQIGGGLARSCVVSLADYDTWENREVADICRDSINDPHHIVFGRPDIMRWHNEHKAPELLQFLTD